MDEYLTHADVAAMLRLSTRTVRELRKKGLLECVRLSPRRIGFTREAVERYIANLNHQR